MDVLLKLLLFCYFIPALVDIYHYVLEFEIQYGRITRIGFMIFSAFIEHFYVRRNFISRQTTGWL